MYRLAESLITSVPCGVCVWDIADENVHPQYRKQISLPLVCRIRVSVKARKTFGSFTSGRVLSDFVEIEHVGLFTLLSESEFSFRFS